MTSKELLNPRFEVIADYPGNDEIIGHVLECPNFDNDFTVKYWCERNEKYPNLFRKLNWWEKRNEEDMPKRLICKAIPGDTEIIEIESWNMSCFYGWIDKRNRKCCSLHSFNPKYGYFPVD